MPVWKPIVGKSFAPADFPAYVRSVKFAAWRPQFVVLHNTAAPKLSQWHSAPGEQRMKNFENFYKNVQKWSAGPHLFVADDLIWVFTPLNTPGVHSPSWNSISWGVEMVGDYASEPFGPDGVKRNAVIALASLYSVLGKDPSTLKLHQEDKLTNHICPGKNVKKADMIARVMKEMTAMNPGDHAPGTLPS